MLERDGRNEGPVHREGCGVPQNGTPRDTVHLHRRPPRASMGYCRPPRASTGYRRPPPASTGSCSSSLHRALLHRLLFNQPSPRAPVQPPLHGLLFIHSRPPLASTYTVHPRAPVHPASTVRYSTGYCPTSPLHGLLFNHPSTSYCSSSPPPSTVHPALHTTGSYSTTPPRPPLHRLLFIQPSTPWGAAHPEATPALTVYPPPSRNAHCSSNRSASVSSSSEGIAPSGSVNSHRSIARVQ